MGLRQRQELTAVAAPAPDAAATAAAAEEPPPPPLPEGKVTKEPDLKKRKKKHEEQEPTPPACKDGSKKTKKKKKKRKAGRLTADDGEAKARLFLEHAASGTAAVEVDCKYHPTDGCSVDKEKEDYRSRSRVVVQDMGVEPRGGSAVTMSLAPGARRRKKKLLILDLNGLLADINQDKHNAHLSHGKFRGKLVFKRPYCDDFLRFCIHHFELGIWSSRLRANVDAVVDILMKDLKHHLLFCWDMSKCTDTGLNTLENKAKPLVLKELKKLWDKEEPEPEPEPDDHLPWQQGDFSPSNTLLVDDSPYKALRNPPHTAIFPCPYSYKNDEDNALGPDGELRLYLASLAAADDDDVPGFVREHPFGQPPITDTHPDWNFYSQILH